jgi:RimJ/RimL family protein N-acetyltransferase
MSNQDSRRVSLRKVLDDDLLILFEQQKDPVAVDMAVVPARDRPAHMAHWRKVLNDDTIISRTVLSGGEVAGHIVSWEQDGRRKVGYWLGQGFWGRGTATVALSAFLEIEQTRPLYAHVAKHNVGSLRVLEKCGFTASPQAPDAQEVVLVLED